MGQHTEPLALGIVPDVQAPMRFGEFTHPPLNQFFKVQLMAAQPQMSSHPGQHLHFSKRLEHVIHSPNFKGLHFLGDSGLGT